MNDKERLAVARAEHAQRIVTDPLFVEAMNLLESSLKDELFNTDITDTGARERIYQMELTRRRFASFFHSILVTGNMVKKQLSAAPKQTWAERLKKHI